MKLYIPIKEAVLNAIGNDSIDTEEVGYIILPKGSPEVESSYERGWARAQVRSKINEYLRKHQAKAHDFCAQPDFFGDEIQSHYTNNKGVWKRIGLLTYNELMEAKSRLKVQVSGLKSHILALDELLEKCEPVWKEHPEFVVDQCIEALK